MVSGRFGGIRQPEYTGENRCLPCTVVNVVIAAVLAGAVAIVSHPLALVTFAVALAVIYLRGYLVPGTPTLTKRYLPDSLLRRFGKGPRAVIPDDQLDVETALRAAGAVTDCEHEPDVCLTETFRAAWRARIRSLRANDTTRDDLATILGLEADALTFQDHGDAFVVEVEGHRVGQWESRAAFIADIAAGNEFQDSYANWAAISVEHRSRLLHGLRIFLERCPACDGPVSIDQDVVESCCRSFEVVAATCDSCGARLFEAEHAPA